MTALDTNILVRYLTQDDEPQFLKVLQMLNRKRATFFTCDLVIVETAWVLGEVYGWTPEEVADAFSRLATIPNLIFENENRLRASLKAFRDGADLADELIVRTSRDLGANELATFDKGVIRRHKAFARLP